MADKLFDIPSPPTNAIVLDKNRKGTVQFTVTNISGRPIRRVAARLAATPDEAALYKTWLSLDPSGFKDYGIAGVQQYTAQVEAPETGAPGNYAFSLKVWEDGNEDDSLAISPSVTFTLAQTPVKKATPFPWWIPVVAVAVIVLIVGIAILTRPASSSPTPTVTITPTSLPPPTPTATAAVTVVPPQRNTWLPHLQMKGDSQKTYVLRLTQPGTIKVDAVWSSNASNLSFSIRDDTGKTRANQQPDGTSLSPSLTFNVTDADFHASDTWQLTIINLAPDRADGTIAVHYPGGGGFKDGFSVMPRLADLVYVIVPTGAGDLSTRAVGAPAGASFTITRPEGGTASLVPPNSNGILTYTVDPSLDRTLLVNVHFEGVPNANGQMEIKYP